MIMVVDHRHNIHMSRNGITLLEVLIAIGILAIGLSTVISLVPAGRSQASRAVVLDRASNLAANALSDAATFGLLRPASLTPYSDAELAYIDPTLVRAISGTVDADPTNTLPITSVLGLQKGMIVRLPTTTTSGTVLTVNLDSNSVTFAPPAPKPSLGDPVWFSPSFATPVFNKSRGIFGSTTDLIFFGPVYQLPLGTQSRDDLLFAPDPITDNPPLNLFSDGVRSFQGRMSCIYAIRPAVSGTPGTLSAIVFHARDPAASPTTMILQNGFADASGLGDSVKPGVVVYSHETKRFHQVLSFSIIASRDPLGVAAPMASMTFSTGTNLLFGSHTLTVLPDSVGLAERTFTAEETGPYLQ
jgi:type II secretory pathway pseudopilin PulG